MSFPPLSGIQVNSVPQGGTAGQPQPRIILESSPGAPLLVRSFPGGASGGQPFLANVVFDQQVTSLPLPGIGGQPQPSMTFVMVIPPRTRPLRTWQRDVQKYAIGLERQRHVQALWQYGELTVFALLWTTVDLANGLAVRCPRCFTNTGESSQAAAEAQISAVYGQGNQYRCPTCFNAQLVAASPLSGGNIGLRALLVRPAIFTDLDKSQQFTTRGVMNTGNVNVESTPDFRVRDGDYMLRIDNSRFRLRVPKRVTLRSGFASPFQGAAAITYNQARAGLEDPTSVAGIIPPDGATLQIWLGTYTRVPVSYSGLEIINGPLIPEDAIPPSATSNLEPSATFPLPIV